MKEKYLSEEQLDFLREMMNIGAGNAATALSKLLQCDVDVRIPMVNVFSPSQVPSVLSDPSIPVVCVRMRMVGEVVGTMFFIVPDEQKMALIQLAELASGMWNSEFGMRNGTPQSAIRNLHSDDLSALAEIGNILAGVYLTAIHDFCKLNMYHTVPRIAIDMIQSLLDESLASLSREVQELLLITNEFITDEGNIRTFFLLIPSAESVRTLADSIEEVRRAYGDTAMGRWGDGATGRTGDK